MNRIANFYAGPSVLPVEVLEELSREMVDYKGTGLSLIETSHRSSVYEEVHNRAIELLREIFNVPTDYHILLLQGGGTLQFGMIPMNLSIGDLTCDYVITGKWSQNAYDDAKRITYANAVYDGRDTNYTHIPEPDEIKLSRNSSYCYITSNETIGGIQWNEWPDTGDIPLVCDMSSDILSRPVPVENFGLIYAGAQKNLGPAGVTIVIIRDDLLKRAPDNIPVYLNYNSHVKNNSLYNTPPMFSIWSVKILLEYMKKNGGLPQVVDNNKRKADLIYNAIKLSAGFYISPVEEKSRSLMNVVFTIKNRELESLFLKKAAENNFTGLKGHKSVGGLRASLYNSLPISDVLKLSEFMLDFYNSNK